MTLNELVKLTTLWTTGPRQIFFLFSMKTCCWHSSDHEIIVFRKLSTFLVEDSALSGIMDKVPFCNSEKYTQHLWCKYYTLDMPLSSWCYNKGRNSQTILPLRTPRKPASENAVCLCRLLSILANCFCIQANSVDLEQSDLGPHCLQKWLLKSQADNIADDNCCDWQFKG